jgi:multisubunit Na+/H+ antiporter MnhB subunit
MFVRATIREHFQRVQKRTTMSLLSIIAATALAAVYVCFHRTGTGALIGGALVGIGVVFVIVILSKRASACPKCRADLAKLQKEEIGRTDARPFWQRWDRCPKCGVDFNDALPS